jgi:glycosyltransferase involved in cell wall biosynthesis
MRNQLPANLEHPMGLKILVAALGGSSQISGTSRHTVNLIDCLLTRDDVSEVHLALGAWQLASFCSVLRVSDPRLHLHVTAAGNRMFARNWWYWNGLPELARSLGVDLVHLSYPALLRHRGFTCPTVVTLHDLYPYDIPGNFDFPKMFIHRAILQQCLAAVDAIACVSESTRQRLNLYVSERTLDKSVTIYNCVEPQRDFATHAAFPGWQGEKFLLCVAQHRRNKNVLLAIKIFEELLRSGDLAPPTRLVVVGISGPETRRIHRCVHESGLGDRVVLLEGISEADLNWCYGHCELLLAPSNIEGFGLPVVEAMFHQCRVVCSDIPAFREVGGNYCYYVALQPDPLGAFVEASRTALKCHTFRPSDHERFSKSKIAEGYLRLYTRLHKAVRSVRSFDAVCGGELVEGRKP